MQYRSGNEIRELFLRFFETKGHLRVHSSSLVPANDPTLLFTNAGMNQFKDFFLALDKLSYVRATSSQKCVRAGGKHNDLENVGFTRRHHTFFEMLGNFSFGDYFKRDAIRFAWELVTSEEWFGIPKDRLYVTIFEGTADVPRDDEAEKYWMEVGVPKERIGEYGVKDNFWQMGETGPCGPCSEIFYDMGLEAAETTGPDGSKIDLPFGKDDARYVEIWNLVFMQFDRSTVVDAAGKTTGYKLAPLPKPSIDTGMGLERVAAVLQRKVSNFETDLFTPLIVRAAELCEVTGKRDKRGVPEFPTGPIGYRGPELASNLPVSTEQDLTDNASLRIIADHARAAAFLINDGVVPSNEGRGYVLRKIMRRAIRHGRLLGQEKPFLFEMVFAVRDLMKGAYPELVDSADRVAKVVEAEEKQFDRVLREGTNQLEYVLARAVGKAVGEFIAEHAQAIDANAIRTDYLQILRTGMADARRTEATQWGIGLLFHYTDGKYRVVIPGETAFHLYETYGLPLDFMVDATRDLGVLINLEEFEAAKESEQARARASWKGGSQKTASPAFRDLPKTVFEGYQSTDLDELRGAGDCEGRLGSAGGQGRRRG